MSEINPQISTAAVVGWPSGDTFKYLAEPDPKQSTLTFKTRVDETVSLFEIWVPMYLKLTDKKAPKLSSLILSIPLSTIETFSFQVLATVPQPVRGKHISQVLGLDFKLNENITVLIPLYTKEQPMQGKTQSGAVLDNVRVISQMTSFSVYINHTASHEADLNSIRNAMNGGRHRLTRKRHLDLQSLYQGQGAQIACLTPQSDELPAYDEVPSSSLDTTTQKRKRPRRELIDHERKGGYVGKGKTRLEKALDDQKRGPGPGVSMAASAGQTVEKGIKTAQKEIKDLRRRIKTAEQEIEALQRQNDNIDFEGYDAKLWEVQQEVKELDETCSGINDNMVTQENLRDFGEDLRQDIGRRISGDDY
ncbi:uncharacterized protein FFB20_13590 [Fusarium fujikuroi]|uniref:Uncharacterized protein n=1 Tax=Gibberella fujikuroi (strain CBS 195.34 / IMI 58289 / NRRL A-6831) TaxID=1279085 RepID=S0ENC9_GIBF5|nr:uncharacterized protein FFUJ_14144 [Fusarium fujikuroi IMI 58289]KLO90081.1 uncharacterized protein Y057_8436 [Fusarium fujikuroi]KLP16867.1 uncharacterized protein LW94_9384 [Fusarium fujikuroi]CCT76222.1 uncharacterized protein FFUJ_14144 [Fusarium fujikuroi IMI 58289]SCO10628.1 uncharacterized protein FFB20_13590 [Fusarium fujikuroi]SCO23862.1 uncharacterized protein FFE2_15784 [Fusarium fujikuroi]